MEAPRAGPLEIDVAGIDDVNSLHDALAAAFRFPDYYGMNWDAFEDCIRDVSVPARVIVRGFDALRRALPRDAELLAQCLDDYAAEDIRCKISLEA